MISNIKRTLARHAVNYRGWQTDRKIVVIESDDWGSTCMPSSGVFQKLLKSGVRVDLSPYTIFDALASEQDLEDLFSVILGYKDKKGGHPVITANAVMMNPDFEKIRDSGFQEYHGELFTDTLKKYPAHKRSFGYWQQAVSDGLFFPQFHGREHLNVSSWMHALRRENSAARYVFDEQMFWPGKDEEKRGGVSIRAAFDISDLSEVDYHREIIRDGLQQFKKLFGYRSKSFIAPNFVYHPDLNETLAENGVEVIQGMKYQKLPMLNYTERKMVRRYQGEKNNKGQYNLVRNCVFEPSQNPGPYDGVGECLKGIKNAFLWRKPAIITAHRLNFIGYIVPGNRERNLKLFRELLKSILVQWPDVEFMTSTQLGDLIAESRN